MKYISYVITTMQDVKANGIPNDETREEILTNLNYIFHLTGWKKGELETTHKLLDLVLNAQPNHS